MSKCLDDDGNVTEIELLYQINGGWVPLTQHDGYLTYPVVGGGEERCPCMVFALCDREAVATMPSRPLGDVPSCQRCFDKMERLAGNDV